MIAPALIERITHLLAFMLRHQPDRFGVTLDPYGYAEAADVLRAINERVDEPIQLGDLESAVAAGDRVRYEIVDGRIRALYGHSIPIEAGDPSQPPAELFVGIAAADIERARRAGLRGGRRRFLHLALSAEDAAESGKRVACDYAILRVHSTDAWEDGVNFYDRRSLWLADEVAPQYLELVETRSDGVGPAPRYERGAEGAQRHGSRDQERGPGSSERFHHGARGDAPAREGHEISPAAPQEAAQGAGQVEPAAGPMGASRHPGRLAEDEGRRGRGRRGRGRRFDGPAEVRHGASEPFAGAPMSSSSGSAGVGVAGRTGSASESAGDSVRDAAPGAREQAPMQREPGDRAPMQSVERVQRERERPQPRPEPAPASGAGFGLGIFEPAHEAPAARPNPPKRAPDPAPAPPKPADEPPAGPGFGAGL